MSKIAMSKETLKEVTKEYSEQLDVKLAPEPKNLDTKIIPEKKKMTKEDYKKKFREANLDYQGRLYIDDKYKNPDKILRIDNDDPATRKYLESLGYSVVQSDTTVGSGSLNEPSNMGSAVHIEQGISFSQPGILYEIDRDLYEARKEVEYEKNAEMLEQTIQDSQREDQKVNRR